MCVFPMCRGECQCVRCVYVWVGELIYFCWIWACCRLYSHSHFIRCPKCIAVNSLYVHIRTYRNVYAMNAKWNVVDIYVSNCCLSTMKIVFFFCWKFHQMRYCRTKPFIRPLAMAFWIVGLIAHSTLVKTDRRWETMEMHLFQFYAKNRSDSPWRMCFRLNK